MAAFIPHLLRKGFNLMERKSFKTWFSRFEVIWRNGSFKLICSTFIRLPSVARFYLKGVEKSRLNIKKYKSATQQCLIEFLLFVTQKKHLKLTPMPPWKTGVQ
jgi:hypothetical protein